MDKGRMFAAAVATAFMVLISCLGLAAIPYAEESDVVRYSGIAAVGSLEWHRDSQGNPFLSIGTFEGGREIIRDRDALHRTTYRQIEPPDYSIALGEGVVVSNGYIVLWADEPTVGEPQTREITLTPVAGWEIVGVTLESLRADGARVTLSAGAAHISCTQKGNAPEYIAHTDCAIGITQVLAVDALASASRDDLTMGDYLFRDALGDISLGGLRTWAMQQHNGHMAEDWSRYPATSTVRLLDHQLVFDQFQRFHTVISTTTNRSDTISIYAGTRPALSILADVGTDGGGEDFRIMRLDADASAGTATMWVTAIGTNLAAICVDTLAHPLVWRECSGVTADYTVTVLDGVECYKMSFPLAGNGHFWRARTTIGATTSAKVTANVPLHVPAGLMLESPDGSLWRIRVDNAGNVSAVAVNQD